MEKIASRIYYMDYWRTFIVLVVLIHHSYLSFVIGYDWYVNDLVTSLPFTWSSIILDVFMMPIMFFIAGYFAFPSIKNGVKRFVLKKVMRIAVPFFIGVLFLSPIMLYIYFIQIIDISYFDFWFNYYIVQYLEPSHYWFLSLLFIFFILFAAIYAVMKKRIKYIYEKSKFKKASISNNIVFVVIFLIASIGLFFLVCLEYPDGSWNTIFNIFKFQISRTILYFLYFILGIIVFIKRKELSKKILKATPLLIISAIVSTVAFRYFKFEIYFQYFVSMGFISTELHFYNSIVHVLYCFLIFITLMAIFKKYFNRHSKVLLRLSTNSYKIYIVHLIYVVIIQYSLVNIQIDIFYKFLITAISAFLMSFGTSELLRVIKQNILKIEFIRKIQKKYGLKTMSESELNSEEVKFGSDSPYAIEVKDLKKFFLGKQSFNDVKAVDGISFYVEKGELFGLLGPNGAGKTTTINMLCGLLKPTEGIALVGGYDLKKNLNEVKKLISICPQEAAIFPFLSGRENIEYFGNTHLMSKEKIDERAEELLKVLGLYEASKRKAKGYSGGMKRQLNLLVALINEPNILFLDEPTVGMDPRIRRKTWEFINSLKDENRTIILTTHYIEETEALCDRVAIIDYGKLVALDSPKNLMEKYDAKNLEEVFLNITGRRILEGI